MGVNIRPICGQILLQVVPPAAEEDRGGIIVKARSVREGYRKAFVKRLPDGYRGILEEGQEVLIPPFSGREVILNKEILVFTREDKIEAILEA